MRVLITGANGFVGKSLCPELLRRGYHVRAAVRSVDQCPSACNGVDYTEIGEIGPETDWRQALVGTDVVIHLAGRVHEMKDKARDSMRDYLRINAQGTRRLAASAASSGIRRMIFLSTVKVNGESTSHKSFSTDDVPDPRDSYAVSKWEAEKALREISAETNLEIVILRIPLVYGPGVKGNFFNLLKGVQQKMIFPLASVRNERSLLYVGNLIDAIIICLEHPRVRDKTFFVSDGEDISTPELIRSLAALMKRPCRIWRFPVWALALLGEMGGCLERLFKKESMLNLKLKRLTNGLTVDSRPFQELTGWKPPFSVEEGLRRTADWYLGDYHS